MEFNQDDEFNKSYSKCKFIVKRWEKDFMKTNGRIPSKYDIKEASQTVRCAYKHYFNLKSKVLESSLMDIKMDSDEDDFSNAEFDFPESLESDLNVSNVSFQSLPSTEQIEKLMCDKIETEVIKPKLPSSSKSVWGDHLNKKQIVESASKTSKNSLSKRSSMSQQLFKSCSFNMRNPRKSLSFNKSQVVPDSQSKLCDNTQLESSVLEDSEKEMVSTLSDSIIKAENIEVNKQDISYSSVNAVHNVMSASTPMSVRNINPGWLERCTGVASVLVTNNSNEIQPHCLSISPSDTKPTKESDNLIVGYGIKNLVVKPLKLDDNDSCHSDYVENSESEGEKTTKLNSTYKKIRHIVKKCKIDENPPIKPSKEVLLPEASDTSTKRVNTRRKTGKAVKTLESDSDTEGEGKKIDTFSGSKRKRKVAIPRKKIKKIINPEEINHFGNDLNCAEVSMPRYAINASVLKEHNLVEGLTAALEIPLNKKKRGKQKSDKNASEMELKLEKKVKDGSLNENFVRINLEKKIYVRGKKTMNFSKFKKQQWKNKKKMLGYTPEFPEGGVLKCFKCNQSGHMSRYCRAHKGNELLALEDCGDKSSHVTLQDAEISTNLNKPSISETVSFETITQEKDEFNKMLNKEFSDDTVFDAGTHQVPTSFLKLLSVPLNNADNSQEVIEPLYRPNEDGGCIVTPLEVKSALKLFGHSNFRGGQETAVMRILSGLSTLVTLTTGSGKSLCYQLPAYLYAQHNKCITLVISPLVSLMEDQVTNMPSFVHAACLHTNQSPTQREKIIELIKNGDIHILLISPEAIVSGEKSTGFGSILRQLPSIAFACIDEVHCVSQWSHNFRPSYLMICRVLRESLGVKCVLGLTATATKPTVVNIVKHLEIPDGVNGVITNLPLPNNLILTVSRDERRDQSLLEILQSERFAECNSIIVYCIRRDECQRVAGLIRASLPGSAMHPSAEESTGKGKKRQRFSWIVEAYHAGMSAAKRRQVQKAFMNGELKIVVATVAFGMGIDKSDIRGVIHYNMPSSYESYVQEVGRAGRDGLPAQCHVFIDHNSRDKDELLRHIHANSIERHVIRKLLQKVFVPCNCSVMLKASISENSNTRKKCLGHEVAFSVDETVAELDIPSENISTLLCYLELHPKKYAKVLSNVYIMCKIMSYGGSSALFQAAEKCPPLAMAIALKKKSGRDYDEAGTIEFCVIEVAAAIGWESGNVKYHLKNLEWDKQNGKSKKSLLRVEFSDLGFHIRSPGDLTPSQLDEALDLLYERTQLQEQTMLHQLQEVTKALMTVSFPSINYCSNLIDHDNCMKNSDVLKISIRTYFIRDSPLNVDGQLDERPVNNEQVIADVRGLLSTYKDCTFSGRAVARILQGISSPNFPAIVWGRCRYWRSHLTEDFYKLMNIAKHQIISWK